MADIPGLPRNLRSHIKVGVWLSRIFGPRGSDARSLPRFDPAEWSDYRLRDVGLSRPEQDPHRGPMDWPLR